MWKLNSVEFSPKIALKDLPDKSSGQIFDAWLDRIKTYYILGAQEMDKTENGFVSMILQLCALDALGTLLIADSDAEDRVRVFCQNVIKETDSYSLDAEVIEKASQHLYFQYRFGLIHNGFTLQVGRFAKNNEPDHIFLISYATPCAVIVNIAGGQKAFITNPRFFRDSLELVITRLKKETPSKDNNEIAGKILHSLSAEIAIAKSMR